MHPSRNLADPFALHLKYLNDFVFFATNLVLGVVGTFEPVIAPFVLGAMTRLEAVRPAVPRILLLVSLLFSAGPSRVVACLQRVI